MSFLPTILHISRHSSTTGLKSEWGTPAGGGPASGGVYGLRLTTAKDLIPPEDVRLRIEAPLLALAALFGWCYAWPSPSDLQTLGSAMSRTDRMKVSRSERATRSQPGGCVARRSLRCPPNTEVAKNCGPNRTPDLSLLAIHLISCPRALPGGGGSQQLGEEVAIP